MGHLSGSYTESREDLLRRLNKIAGQVKGIQRMVSEDKYCVDVLIQIAAVRSALNKVGTIIFEHHTRGCLTAAVKIGNEDEMITELMEVIGKFIK